MTASYQNCQCQRAQRSRPRLGRKLSAAPSLGADRLPRRLAGAGGPVAARHSRLRVPLLLVPAFLVRLPDRCDGQLRRADAGGLGVPYLLLGLLLLVGAASGSLVCGWACPFGFLQDLLGKIVPRKISLPGWVGYFRYVVLVGLVILLPMILGFKGIPFEDQVDFHLPALSGGRAGSRPAVFRSKFMAGNGWLMSWIQDAILMAFFAAALFIHRPWCRIFCPLGGLLALFNRFSLFHLRFKPKECVECNLCRSRCSMGVKVDQKVNVSGCIRCLECTTCGAIEPCFALPENQRPKAKD